MCSGVPRRLVLVAACLGVPGAGWAQVAAPVAAATGSPPAADTGMDAGPPLDPASPMAEMPELGVAWPDLATPPAAGPSDGRAQVDAAAEQRYRFQITGLEALEGVDPSTVRLRFDGVSTLKEGANKPANVAQIDRRAREDEQSLREVLRSYGYYDADVTARVESREDAVVVTLNARPGPLYRFTSVALPGLEHAGEKAGALGEAFAVKPNDPVDAAKVEAAETNLKVALGRQGFAFAKVGELAVTVDHEAHTATLALPVDPGGGKRFGDIRVEGRRLFSVKHLAHIARFKRGDEFDAAKLDDFRRALIQTGLVSAVELKPTPDGAPNYVDIGVKLERAPPRTIAGELGYGTGSGARAAVSWTHRNLIKPEGQVTLAGVLGTQEQSASVQLRRNNYKARDRILSAQIAASHTHYQAYDARTFSITGTLERQTNIIWQKKWTWSVGTELLISDERDVIASTGEPRRRTYYIAALPGTLAYDGTDDLLNPTRGYRLAGRISPELSFRGQAFTYARAQVDGSAYLPLGRTVFAGRIRVGSIFGAQRDDIAPSRRFYSGGGGSVRGYGYQDIGPRDANNDPIGGRSLAEFAIEARVRFGNFGVVPFFDGGNLYTQTLPRFTGLRYGTGLGVRYYSSFGPIRIDLGTPVNPQKGDPRVAVYVSLGQAF